MKNQPDKIDEIHKKLNKKFKPDEKKEFIALLERLLSRIKSGGKSEAVHTLNAEELRYCEAEAIPPLDFLKAKSSHK